MSGITWAYRLEEIVNQMMIKLNSVLVICASQNDRLVCIAWVRFIHLVPNKYLELCFGQEVESKTEFGKMVMDVDYCSLCLI